MENDASEFASPLGRPFSLRTNPRNPRVGEYGKDVRTNKDGSPKEHKGWDIEAEQGEPVLAVEGGKVKSAGWQRGYGKSVEISHPNEGPNGSKVSSFYAHLDSLTVNKGDQVDKGQQIGTVGRTAVPANLPANETHLHFEARENGEPVDPGRYIGHHLLK